MSSRRLVAATKDKVSLPSRRDDDDSRIVLLVLQNVLGWHSINFIPVLQKFVVT
jgi:hypothetical protein